MISGTLWGVTRSLVWCGLAALSAAVLAVAAGAAAATAGSVRVTRLSPLTVNGSSFAPRSRHVVVARGGGRVETRLVTTGRGGPFVGRFPLGADPCSSGFTIVARRRGLTEAEATTKLVARSCMPAGKNPGGGPPPAP